MSKFKFLTRLHYWAADVVTHGPESEWGEHEIDYILFIQGKIQILIAVFCWREDVMIDDGQWQRSYCRRQVGCCHITCIEAHDHKFHINDWLSMLCVFWGVKPTSP